MWFIFAGWLKLADAQTHRQTARLPFRSGKEPSCLSSTWTLGWKVRIDPREEKKGTSSIQVLYQCALKGCSVCSDWRLLNCLEEARLQFLNCRRHQPAVRHCRGGIALFRKRLVHFTKKWSQTYLANSQKDKVSVKLQTCFLHAMI